VPLHHQKEKEKKIQKKRNIKSRKIDKRKRKMLVSKAFHNTSNNPGKCESLLTILFISFSI